MTFGPSRGRVRLPRGLLLVVVVVVLVGVALVVFRAPRPPDEDAFRLNNLGVARLEQFDPDGASQSFRQALKLDPDLPMARINLAIALLQSSELDEAESQVRVASQSEPDSPHAHYVLGLVLRQQNRLDEAIAAFTRVAQIDARDAGAAVNLGQMYLERRQYAAAVSEFTRALDAEPYSATAAYGLATALTRAGRADESAAAMTRFEALRSTAYATTFSQTYLEQGRYGEAIASTGLEPALVDASTPAVAYADVTSTALGDHAERRCASLTLHDLDRDGDLDLALPCDDTVLVLKNDGGRFVLDGEVRLTGTQSHVLGAGDFDNDGLTDLFVAGEPTHRLLMQQPEGAFADRTTGADLSPATGAARAVAVADLDHDGDLDLIVGDDLRFLRNNGNNTFTDATAAAGLTPAGAPVRVIVATDFDDRRDIDVLVGYSGAAPALYRNLRDGRFRDVATAVGLPPRDAYTTLATGDLNKDLLPDFFFGRNGLPGLLVVSRGPDRMEVIAGPPETVAATAALLVDYDNDGLLDLLVLTARGPRLWRYVSQRWLDVSARAFPPALHVEADPMVALAMGDLDGDGDADLVGRLESGRLRVLQNDGGSANRSLRVRLAPRVSNRGAVGAKVDLRAGSLRQRIEVRSSTPAAAPADLIFGLGRRAAADVVRVQWPAGILQAETALADPVMITELDRKPSSCPFLYTWNGSRFEFVTDFLGGGEMGLWVPPPLQHPGPSAWSQPDPDEYVRIREDQLRARDCRYEIRVTNELEEATFVDRLELVAIDHGHDVSIFPNEGLTAIPKPFELSILQDLRPLAGAVDDHGHDAGPALAEIDRQSADHFALSPIQGYAEPHALTLDPGADAGRAVLLLTGWTDYAFSSDNVAAHQAGLVMRPPSLQVQDAGGVWRTVIDDIGFPVGRPQTIVVDLPSRLPGGPRAVRIVTNMRVYWDRILVATRAERPASRVTRRHPDAADLEWRGFSTPVSPDGRTPFGYDYARPTSWSPWKTLTGAYTREGDVRQLVVNTDDLFVVSMPGDEIAVSWDESVFPPLGPGLTRTFLLYAVGFSKEMNPRSAAPDRLEPLPFHRMTGYPYGPTEAYPLTPATREYLRTYQTRTVRKPVPPLETSHQTEGQRR